RSAPLRSAVLGGESRSRARRAHVPRQPQPEFARDTDERARGAEPGRRTGRHARAVRAARPLLRRSRVDRVDAGLQSRGVAAGHLVPHRATRELMMRASGRMSWTTALVVCLAANASAQQVVRYEPGPNDLKYVYATVPAVATLKPGDTLETKTVDAFGNVIKKPGDTMAMVKRDNPLTGPFAIAGAEPRDTLVVKILELKVDSTRGVGALAPGFGALNTTSYT